MSGAVFWMLAPLFIWAFREAIVNLAADCIAEGIRRANREGGHE
jgi:hypothetical protein